jgi:molybdate transport system substrate-binding protein
VQKRYSPIRGAALAWLVVHGAFLLAAAPGISPAAADGPLVSAAASLTDALSAAARQYEQDTGTRLALNFGPSSGLARQIRNGAPVDLFISADEAQMDAVAAAGLLDPATRVDLLHNALVIVMPSDRAHALGSARDLADAAIRRIALADPDAVPAGVYARRYLESLGLWTPLASRLVPTSDVRAALAAIDSGNADAAFVYRTDAAIAKRAVVVFRVPPAEGPRIVYPAAIVRTARHAAGARALLAYLQGPAARAIFDRFGFVTAHAR